MKNLKKYNISSDKIVASSSEQLKSQTGYDKGTNRNDKKKKNIQTELNEQQGKGKIEGSLEPQSSIKSYEEKLNNPIIYSGNTKDFSLLLSQNPNPTIKELFNKQSLRDLSGLNNPSTDRYALGKDNYNEQQRLDDIILKQGMDIMAQQA